MQKFSYKLEKKEGISANTINNWTITKYINDAFYDYCHVSQKSIDTLVHKYDSVELIPEIELSRLLHSINWARR